jgi:hypothetical protein
MPVCIVVVSLAAGYSPGISFEAHVEGPLLQKEGVPESVNQHAERQVAGIPDLQLCERIVISCRWTPATSVRQTTIFL